MSMGLNSLGNVIREIMFVYTFISTHCYNSSNLTSVFLQTSMLLFFPSIQAVNFIEVSKIVVEESMDSGLLRFLSPALPSNECGLTLHLQDSLVQHVVI